MPLAEAADRFCPQPLPADRFDYRTQIQWRDDRPLDAGRTAILKRMDDVRRMREQSAACVDVLNELVGLTDRPDEFNRRLARVDDLRAQIQQQPDAYVMVSMMAQHAELRRLSADRRIGAQALEGAERAKRQLARDIEFVQSMIDAADALLDVLDEARQRFDHALGEALPSRPDVHRDEGAKQASHTSHTRSDAPTVNPPDPRSGSR
jgi:hypothetical protein